MEAYEYSYYNDFNRFSNIDGIEAKIIEHLLSSKSKYAENFWKILAYNEMDALSRKDLTRTEKQKLVDGYEGEPLSHLTDSVRLFLSPFVDESWTKESSSVYIFVDDIYPIDQGRAVVSVTVETVIHSKINVIYGDADMLANPEGTNPNDYYYKDDVNPTVRLKSRASVLLECLLGELNGLYIDGIGYLQFNNNKTLNGGTVNGKAKLTLFNNRSFFGHSIQFNVAMSGVSGAV